jgi:hypothetical protein
MKYVLFSMDCELAWGLAHRDPPVERVELMKQDPSNVRDAYRTLVDLYETYEIPATWAFVGHLFYNECDPGAHINGPNVSRADPLSSRNKTPLYYGDDIIQWVLDNNVDHDIGGHAFSHVEFSEVDESVARSELEAMVTAAKEWGIDIDSFVYPMNSVAHEHLLPEFGIQVYRDGTLGNNYTLRHGIRPMLARDRQFWSVPSVSPEREATGLVRIDASRLLHEERFCYLHPMRLRRTLDRISDGGIVHFAFHPHDLLNYYRLDWVLERVLSVVDEYRNRGEVEPITMADLPDLC